MNTEPPPLKQPDKDCKHEDFHAFVNCGRIAKSDSPNAVPYIYTAELRVQCKQCGGDFMFDGLPWAISLTKPCMNVTGTEARIPMQPWDGAMTTGTCIVEMPK